MEDQPRPINRHQVEVRFIDSVTKEEIAPTVIGTIEEVSEPYNQFVLATLGEGHTLVSNVLDPNGRSVVATFSNGVEIHILPDPIH